MKTKPAIYVLTLALTVSPLWASPFEVSVQHVAPPRSPASPNSGSAVFPDEFRSIDGSGNNPIDSTRGAANTPLIRNTTNAYADGSGLPAGGDQRSAREISNLVVAQDHLIPNAVNASDFLWQWGQFIDHDMDLTPSIDPAEPFNIPVPPGDPFFDPNNTGTQFIELDRSFYEMINGVREQVNIDTAYIDASQVYGSDQARAQELRRLDGSGKLKTSTGNLLPYNIHGLPNLPTTDATFFLAGDLRSNEQLGLTAMHTLFVREHNFWADVFHAAQPNLNDDGIYFRARAIVAAEIQIITYRDFLPLLMGNNPLAPYHGYRPQANAGIANVFSAAAFRVGHTLLSPQLLRLDNHNRSIGDISLADSFFNPTQISSIGIEPYLRGLAKQRPQEVDAYIVDPVRNFLFGQPGQGGFDLASLNIQRGRDHGLPRYNRVRMDYGLAPYTTFAQINPDPVIQAKLAAAYATPDDIDVWLGSLAEKHKHGMMVSETTYTILKDQFERLRDGDRFWYETYLPHPLVVILEHQPLSDIIRRNTTIGHELQDDVFRVPNH
ncbi:MAG: peroxidase family protein [Candidatus Udaeobacter sp.]